MNRGISQTVAIAALIALANQIQAEPPRTLVSVVDPLEELGKALKEIRERAAKELTKAREALQIAELDGPSNGKPRQLRPGSQ